VQTPFCNHECREQFHTLLVKCWDVLQLCIFSCVCPHE
jgi:hypothetical protein